MGNKTARFNLRMKEELYNEVDRIANNNNVSKAHVVEAAIKYYIDNDGKDYAELYDVLKRLFEPLYDEVKRLRHSNNQLNNSSMMLKELINHYFIAENKSELVTTNKSYAPELAEIEAMINEGLRKKRTKKMGE